MRPFLAAAGSYDRDGVAEKVARDPEAGGLMVVEVDGERAGAMDWEVSNRRSGSSTSAASRCTRASVAGGSPTTRPACSSGYLIRERGFHRIELEIYGFNERAQRHAERSGFVREGVKRNAYRRGDGWVDGVLYAFVEEDLAEPR